MENKEYEILAADVKCFRSWLNLQYEACKKYGEEGEIDMVSIIKDKFDEVFDDV